MDITVHFAARAIDAVRSVAVEEILPRYRSIGHPAAGASQGRYPTAAAEAWRKDDGSMVTDADYAAQHALVRRLHALEPLPIMGEEMPSHEQLAIFERGGRFWCVDPLDGTRNFCEGIPFFAVSVALMEGPRPLFGIVYDPIADEAFYAVEGGGAWVNHRPLVVPSRGPSLAHAVAEVSLRRETARLRGALKRRQPYARRLTSGSSALSWCHLAAARVDVMLHGGQKMWDWAAGSLILAAAGGSLATLDGDDYWQAPLWSRSAIAARTAPLLAEWRGWIRKELDLSN